MLMRDPPATAPPKVAHKTGKEVDDALDASPFFAKLVAAKHKAGTKAEGHVHIHNDAAFEAAYVKMALKRTNPATRKVFTEAEARTRSQNVNAFRDGSEIHVHGSRGTPSTTVHESLHLFADAYRDKMDYNANDMHPPSTSQRSSARRSSFPVAPTTRSNSPRSRSSSGPSVRTSSPLRTSRTSSPKPRRRSTPRRRRARSRSG